MKTGPKPRDQAERFLEKVSPDPNSGCWLWLASWDKNTGYGKFGVDHNHTVPAHVASYMLFVGQIVKGMIVHHKCETRICVNPQHLEQVTRRRHLLEIHKNTIPYLNAAKTHCQYGHPFDEANTYYPTSGGRQCKECHRIREVAKYGAGREVGPWNQNKTHCKHGHEFTVENTFIRPNGTRKCRYCDRLRHRNG